MQYYLIVCPPVVDPHLSSLSPGTCGVIVVGLEGQLAGTGFSSVKSFNVSQ